MMKSLFGQFSPDFLSFIPLQMMSCILAIIWMMFIFPTNFFSGQMTYIWIMIRLEAMKLLFQNSKEKSAPWTLLITTMFFLILSMKLMGLLPYAFTMTSHVSFTYSMAIPLWLSMKILGFYLAFNSRLSHLVPQGTPSFLIPLMVWMETLSLFAQPMALGLRLAANLTAGHLLMFLLSTATWILMSSPMISALIMFILILLFLLEMGVACIQAYVFTSLVKFYLDQNM